jgi:hypothetical protein
VYQVGERIKDPPASLLASFQFTSDLDMFVDDLDDLSIHASTAKIEVESAPGATSSGAAATSLELDSF